MTVFLDDKDEKVTKIKNKLLVEIIGCTTHSLDKKLFHLRAAFSEFRVYSNSKSNFNADIFFFKSSLNFYGYKVEK